MTNSRSAHNNGSMMANGIALYGESTLGHGSINNGSTVDNENKIFW